MLQEKIAQELAQIPPDKLVELYDLIHYFRLGLEHEQQDNPTMQLAGSWADLPERAFQSFIDDHRQRRQGF